MQRAIGDKVTAQKSTLPGLVHSRDIQLHTHHFLVRLSYSLWSPLGVLLGKGAQPGEPTLSFSSTQGSAHHTGPWSMGFSLAWRTLARRCSQEERSQAIWLERLKLPFWDPAH